MLDLKSKIVLKILSKECPNGAYKIVDASDIISAMPSKYKVNTETLKHILIYLERQDCISIKYDDENIYCLAVLPLGFEICETSSKKEGQSKKQLPIPLYFFIIFLLGFCASFLANILARLIVF